MDVKLWLQELYHPAVLVACSPAAEAICAVKNGLSFVDVLRPYSQVPQLNVAVRLGESAVRVSDLKVAFHTAATMFQPKLEVIEEHLKGVLMAAAQKHAKLEATPDLLAVLQTERPMDMQDLTPWFVEYRAEFLRLLAFGDHETLDHPVAVMLVVPSDVSQPASHFEKLLEGLVLPPLMQSEFMLPIKDVDLPKHYVLLHDVSAGADDKKAQDNLTNIRRAFGEAHCSLLHINSGSGDPSSMGAPPDFFKRFQRPCLPGGGAGEPEARPPPPPLGVGVHLTVQDLDALAHMIRDFVTRTLLPKLEERVLRLNANITATRKGLRNRFNRFWKGSTDDTSTDKPYPFHTVEAQMRQLGDLAFLLHAYDVAAASYRLAAQDYQAAQNNKWYAGVEEMIGLCCILDPMESNDPLKYFTRAYEAYSKLPGKLPRMLATRSSLLLAAFQQRIGRYLSTSHVLMRAHFDEENARAALLLEQAAYALLYLKPPSTRKFAFQTVLAGLRYHSCGQKRLAMHAYRQVMVGYHGKQWRAIEEHLNDVLGKLCKEFGDADRALWHFTNLLDCGHRAVATQTHYLTQFLDGVKRVQAKGGPRVLDTLPLPLVAHRDVRVTYNDQCCYAGAAAQQVPASTWASLEQCCSVDAAAGGNWLDGGKQERDGEEYNSCIAGEEVCVDVQFTNPLNIKIKLSSVRLLCEFTPVGETNTSTPPLHTPFLDGRLALSDPCTPSEVPVLGAAPPTASAVATSAAAGLPAALSSPTAGAMLASASASSAGAGLLAHTDGFADPLHLGAGSPQADGLDPLHPLSDHLDRHRFEHVHIVDDKFTLHPGEVLVEQLRLCPLQAGWLRVVGVQWVLNDVAEGRVFFEPRGRHRKKPKGPRPGQMKHYAPSRRLLFHVLPAMPRLEVLMDSIPTSLYSGEVARVTMVLCNRGSLPLHNLQLVIAHPEVACAATAANLQRSAAQCLQDPLECIVSCRLPGPAAASPANKGVGLYRVWEGLQLQPGQKLEWPLWMHPRGVGVMRFNCVWYCEPTVPVAMKCRTLRIAAAVQVNPLLSVKASANPSATDLANVMLRLELESSREGEHLAVPQLTCASKSSSSGASWSIRPVSNQAAADAGVALVLPLGAGNSGSSGRTLQLGMALQPGESTDIFAQLTPPPAPMPDASSTAVHSSPAGPVLGSQSADVVHSLAAVQPMADASETADTLSSSGRSSNGYAPPAVDFFGGGVLSHFYGLRTAVKGTDSAAESGRSQRPVSSAAAAASATEAAGAAAATAAAGPKTPADPPFQLLVVWRVLPDMHSRTMERAGGAERFGICRPKDAATGQDLSLALKAQAAPVRLLLLGPTSLRHDFRQSTLCVVPLRLLLRNCCSATVQLQVEAGHGWQNPDVTHSWFASAHPLPPLLTSPSSHHLASSHHPSSPNLTPSLASSSYGVMPSSHSATSLASTSLHGFGPNGAPLHGGGVPNTAPPGVADSTHSINTAAAMGSTSQGFSPGVASSGMGSQVQLQQLHHPPVPSSPPGITYQAGLDPASEFEWCGPTSVAVGPLAPGQTAEVALQVAVFRPGMYLISGVKVSCMFEGTGGPAAPVLCLAQPLLLRLDAGP